MKNIAEFDESSSSIIQVDKRLDDYKHTVLFPKKLEKATKILKKVGLPNRNIIQKLPKVSSTSSAIINEITVSFEEILNGFMNIETAEKSSVFKEKLSIFLKTKTPDERKFIASVLMSIMQDNASQLFQFIKENKDIEMLELLEQKFRQLK